MKHDREEVKEPQTREEFEAEYRANEADKRDEMRGYVRSLV